MVMARREGVAHAAWPITVTDLAALAGSLGAALLRVPLRRPWRRPGPILENLVIATTRETMRTFIGYSSSLPIEEWRSVELLLDDLSGACLSPINDVRGVKSEATTVAGVPGIWYRMQKGAPRGTVLYLHGGGYIGTSPRMYAFFVGTLCRLTQCEFFVADYRLAPEFPFPAGVRDAALVLEALLHTYDPAGLFLAGDSGGGGLLSTMLYARAEIGIPPIGGVILFSPEVDLALDEPSISENAALDILPWNIPTAPYLHGRDPDEPDVSAVYQDVSQWPATFVAFGGDEMFRDSIRRLIAHLVASGVETKALEEPGMFHVFPILMPWAAASQRVFAGLCGFLDKRLSGPTAR